MHLKELKKILDENGIYLSRQRGQNFLIDYNIVRSLLNHVKICENDEILEIGAGLGSLTEHMLKTGARVVSYEIDKKVFLICFELLRNYRNLELVHEDFLKADYSLKFSKKFKVVSNVPYNIASQILIKLWFIKEKVENIYLLLQKEMGTRLTSKEPGKEIGFLSILLQLDFDMQIIRKVPPSAFYPVPDIESVYLELRPKKTGLSDEERKDFFEFVKYGFSERRKKLLPKLKKKFDGMDEIFERLGIRKDSRPEMLSKEDWINIWKLMSAGSRVSR